MSIIITKVVDSGTILFLQDRTNVFIAVEPVGLVGNRGYAAVAADGLKAVGSRAVNSF